jgi:hypothetical protein
MTSEPRSPGAAQSTEATSKDSKPPVAVGEPEDPAGLVVDWDSAVDAALGRMHYKGPPREQQGRAQDKQAGAGDAGAAKVPARWSITEHRLIDAVQEASITLQAKWRTGEHRPATFDDVVDALVKAAKARHDDWRKTSRRRDANLRLLAPTMSSVDMFDVICARDEQQKFFTLLFDALDGEARIMLNVLLKEGIPFHKNKELGAGMHITTEHARRIKRRIVSHAKVIMRSCTAPVRKGGTS